MVNVLLQPWKIWLAIVKVLGTIQMVILLTVVYVIFKPVLFIPAGLIADPLKLRRGGEAHGCGGLNHSTESSHCDVRDNQMEPKY